MIEDQEDIAALPFQGFTVLELSDTVAGAYCTRLLAGLGTDVIKVEPVRGDPIRRLGPLYRDTEDIETGAVHLHLDLSKRSVGLDATTPQGREVLSRLVERADVIVQGVFTASEARVDYGWVTDVRPDVVMATISGFGPSGPYSSYQGTEGVAMAVGGMTFLTGDPGDTPLQPTGNTAQYAAGEYAAVAVTAALFQRRFTGEGQHLEVSVAGAVASIIEIFSQRLVIQGSAQGRTGNWQGPGRGIFPCADGHVGFIMRGREKFSEMADWLGVEELKDERFEPFSRNQELGEDLDQELNGLLTAGLLGHDKLDIYHAMQSLHMPFGYVADFAELLESPQLVERGFFVEVDHPRVGKQLYPRGPFVAEGMKWQLNPAPLLGQHTEEVLLGVVGLTGDEYSALEKHGVVVSPDTELDRP